MSLRRIADEAGVTLSLIDHHFGAKQKLFAESFQLALEYCKRSSDTVSSMPVKADQPFADQVATTLVGPVWQAYNCAVGRDVLALWIRHRHETMPEVRVPLDRAVEPLLSVAAELVCLQRPACARQRAQAICYRAFGTGVELLTVPEDLQPLPALGSDEKASVELHEVVGHMATWLRVGLADPA